jgi:hypothetical protein
MFNNGLGDTFYNEGSLLRGVIETNKQRKSFLESWSSPSSVLHALPFMWDKRKVGHIHYFANIFMAVQIVAMAVGFGSAAAYVRCCGWTYTKREGVAVLHYRKLEDVINKFAPDITAANLA